PTGVILVLLQTASHFAQLLGGLPPPTQAEVQARVQEALNGTEPLDWKVLTRRLTSCRGEWACLLSRAPRAGGPARATSLGRIRPISLCPLSWLQVGRGQQLVGCGAKFSCRNEISIPSILRNCHKMCSE